MMHGVPPRHEAALQDPSIVRIYEAEIGRLTALGRVLTGEWSGGEDLAHEVFIRLLRVSADSPDYLRDPAWPWLRTTLIRLASQRRRQLTRELRRLAHLHRAPEADFWPEEHIDIVAALAALPPRMRACIVLRYSEDLSVAEVAAVLGCAPETVKSQLARGRKRLRTLIDPTPNAGQIT